tara:strand:+ start:815 stop:1006 length:192 start_codon:yes stop_codon:yes gene_type:complete
MPKKKLTKAQIKKKLNTFSRLLRDLLVDKLDYGSSSFVPFSVKRIIDVSKMTDSAVITRMLRK